MSYTLTDKLDDIDKIRDMFLRQMKQHWKLRSCIVEVFGDYYWKETNPEETIKYCFQQIPKELKNQRDIELLIN